MIRPASLSELLLFSTVRIEVVTSAGDTLTGTAFFFDQPVQGGRVLPLIVTNKHVVGAAKTGQFLLHEATTADGKPVPSGSSLTVSMDNFQSYWIGHPDGDVDLAAMPFQPLRAEAERRGKGVFTAGLDPSIILSDSDLQGLSAAEDVLMVGYPIGLWDSANNLPLIRRGITATHPGVDFCGKSVTVIDAACFPGSSGSPVLIVNEGVYSNKQGGTVIGSRAVFLGVLFSGPQMTAEGEIVVTEIPTDSQPSVATRLMINLGYIVKAREVAVLADHISTRLQQASGSKGP